MAVRHVRKRLLSKKQKERLYDIRYKRLLDEGGFTPEEVDLLANVRISSGEFSKIRRKRKRMVTKLMDQGYTKTQAKRRVRKMVKEKKERLVDWDTFRKVVYPERKNSSLVEE